ncbi:MAG: YigZ family protein [Bacteroidetes bacterium]|jgi:uncharacterized YigZ family protein|nr:YigZ family protein [Bacteroidota bacterium]
MRGTSDTYYTIKAESSGEFKDKGSRFIASVFPIQSEEEFQKKLSSVKEDHHKARHFCTAFRLGPLQKLERFNDDGEPSNSAGRPILGQLHRFEVNRVGAIVVRYFGGTKLGVSGLIEAYKKSTAAALKKAKRIKKEVKTEYSVKCPYKYMPILMEALKYAEIDIREKSFEQLPRFKIALPKSKVNQKWKSIATHFVGHDAKKEDLINKYEFSIEKLKTN